jgi:hypothetical protein
MQNNVCVKETGTYGKSIFANRNFKKGDLVFKVEGETVYEPTIYTIPINFGIFIDDQLLGKYLCHSCDPNCGIKDKTSIVTMKDIREGDEIAIDYAMFVPEYGNEITEEQLVCRCGSDICRGRLGSYNRLSTDLRRKYEGYISQFLLENQ